MNKIKKIVNKKNVIIFCVLFIFALIPLLWFRGGTLIVQGDWSFPFLNPGLRLYRSFFAWDEIIRFVDAKHIGWIIINSFMYFLFTISHSFLFLEISLFVVVFALTIIFSYLFFHILFKEIFKFSFPASLSALASLFYATSYAPALMWSGFHITQILEYSLLPFCLYFFIKYFYLRTQLCISKIIATGFLFLLLNLIFTNPSAVLPIVYALLIIIFLNFLLSHKKANITKNFKFVLLLAAIIFFINAYFFIPFLYDITHNYSVNDLQSNNWLTTKSQFSSILNIFRNQGVSAWYDQGAYNAFYKSFSSYFLDSTWFQLLSFVFILSFAYVLIISKRLNPHKRKFIIIFSALYLIFVCLAKGIHPPHENVFLFLYENIPLFWIFRSPWEKFIPIVNLVSILFLFIVLELLMKHLKTYWTKKIFLSLLLIIIVIYNYPFINGNFFFRPEFKEYTRENRFAFISIPNHVFDTINFLNKSKLSYSLLQIPYTTRDGYKWGYETSGNLFSNSVKDDHFVNYSGNNYFYTNIIKKITEELKKEKINTQLLSFLGIKSILLKKDSNNYNNEEDVLNNADQFIIKENKFNTIYSLKKDFFLAKLYRPQKLIYVQDQQNFLNNKYVNYLDTIKEKTVAITNSTLFQNDFDHYFLNKELTEMTLKSDVGYEAYCDQTLLKISKNLKKDEVCFKLTPSYSFNRDLLDNQNQCFPVQNIHDVKVMINNDFTNIFDKGSIFINDYDINIKFLKYESTSNKFIKNGNFENNIREIEEYKLSKKEINTWYKTDETANSEITQIYDEGKRSNVLQLKGTANETPFSIHQIIDKLDPNSIYEISFEHKNIQGVPLTFDLWENISFVHHTKNLTKSNNWKIEHLYFQPREKTVNNFVIFENKKNVQSGEENINLIDNIALKKIFIAREENIKNKFKLNLDAGHQIVFKTSPQTDTQFPDNLIIDNFEKNIDIVEDYPGIKKTYYKWFMTRDQLTGENDIIAPLPPTIKQKYAPNKESNVLQLQSRYDQAIKTYQIIDKLDPNSIYAFSFDYKNVEGNPLHYDLWENISYIHHSKILPKNNDWQKEIYFFKPHEKTFNTFIIFENKKDIMKKLDSINLIDNIKLERIKRIPNIIIKKIDDKNMEKENKSSITFRKVNPTKYKIKINSASENFPLIFSESFHKEWKAYIKTPSLDSSRDEDVLIQKVNTYYKILDGNQKNQATKTEVIDFINKGWIQELGDKIDFISKNFNGTIQNDNLPSESFADTYFASQDEPTYWPDFLTKKSVYKLPEETHLTANGYANSWWIDVEKICGNLVDLELYSARTRLKNAENQQKNAEIGKRNREKCFAHDGQWQEEKSTCQFSENKLAEPLSQSGTALRFEEKLPILPTYEKLLALRKSGQPFCKKNPDGTYDLEMIVEFWPQRLFYLGLFISGLTLLASLTWLGWIYRKALIAFPHAVYHFFRNRFCKKGTQTKMPF